MLWKRTAKELHVFQSLEATTVGTCSGLDGKWYSDDPKLQVTPKHHALQSQALDLKMKQEQQLSSQDR